MKGLVQLFLFRWREFYREPQILFWALGFPLVMMLILGVAFRPKPPGPMTVLVAASPDDPTVAALRSSTDLTVRVEPPAEAELALMRGDAALLVIPGKPPVYKFDEAHPDARQTRLLVDLALHPHEEIAKVELTETPGGRYIDWLVPGLLGMQIMNGSLWGIGFALVEMRAKKLLKRFAVTPMRRDHFLLATATHRFLVVGAEAVLMFAFAMIFFHVPLKGSVLALALVAAVGTFSFGALALVVASRARNTEVAQGLMNIPMLPQIFMSGVFFSSARFPDWMQPAIKLLPLTALIDGMRMVANEGRGLESVWSQIAILAAWAVVMLFVALRAFRWT